MSGRNNNTSEQRKAKDDWRTPVWLWNILNNQYNFEVDCAASAENALCPLWIGIDTTMFPYAEGGTVWCNPPFSNPQMLANYWAKRLKKVGIYRCDNLETKVWQTIILPNVDWVFFPSGRINYEGHDGKGAMFPSCLMGSGVPPPTGIEGRTLICCDICQRFSRK